MKRLYFLLGFCLLNFSTFAVTVTVNATGATGSYKTGYTQAATGRTDGDMVIDATGTIKRGYAVFNLAGVVPPGAAVSAVSVRFNFTTTTTGLGVVCGIRGFAGDLSTVTTPATLYPDCSTGVAFNTTNWGESTTGAQDLLPFNVTGTTFIQTNAGLMVSICFATTSGANVYTITGEGGTTLTQPQLQITYTCAGLTGVTATASPAHLCAGSTLTLTGGATGATSYSWSGPGSFAATSLSTSLTVTPANAGVYTFDAYNAAGCFIPATTAAVTVNPTPAPITGSASVCSGGATTSLTESSTGGTWSSTPTSTATVTTSGTVTGVSPGTAVVAYTTSLGCSADIVVTVNSIPSPISGIASVCVGSNTFLSDPPGTGTWSSSNTLLATVNSSTGTVLGLGVGTPLISYTSAGCPATIILSVNAAPGPIAGTMSACPGTTTALTDPGGSGAWASSSTLVATVNSATGVVTGEAPGSVTISFSNSCGLGVAATVIIHPLPSGINGLTIICLGATATLTDSSAFGAWSVAPLSAVTIGSATGIVTGAAIGTALVTYTLSTSCAATTVMTVNAPPSVILGANSVCTGHTTVLTESSTGGVWSSSNTALATISATGTVGGISFGIDSITYTSGPGCYLTHTMTVNPEAPILGTDSVCVGLSTYLTNIVGGGIWSSAPPGAVSVLYDSGRVTGLVPGNAIITYSLPLTGCQTSVNFSVISFPNAITGIAQVCPGSTTNLFNVTTGGAWSSANNAAATVGATNGIVTAIAADTVSISYSVLPGCAVKTVVTVNPLPAVITGGSPVCPQTIDSLNDVTPGGTWTSSTPSLATVIDTSGVVTTIGQGAAIIKYTLPTGCFRTKTVSVDPLPHPAVTYNWLSNSFYVDIEPQYISYQWYDSIQGMITGATSPSLAALYNEYYFVVVTDTNGCKGASDPIFYNVGELETGNIAANSSIKIYPNPVSGSLNIESPVRVRAVISSMNGKQEMEQADAKEIDISRLSDAMYLISIYDDQGNILTTRKLIKQ